MGSKNKKNKKPTASAPEPELQAPPTNDGGGGGGNRGHKLITDPRFSFAQTDPKFEKNTKHKSSKVSIDSRFNRMFSDKNFATSSARVDKRGKIKKDAPNPLKHYYRMDEEEEGEKEAKNQDEEAVKDDVNDDVSGDSSDGEEEKERESKLKKLWEKLSDSESESELKQSGDEDDAEVASDSDGSSSDSDFDTEDEAYSVDEEVEEENIPEIDKETSRLAVVNMDWNQVKAVDLYVLLSSFLPKDGEVISVSVYPSEFGLKRMEEEAVHGPVGLFDNEKRKEEDDDNDDEMDIEKLRAYELSRLRYYYAVVECDSIATADYLYKTCDGVEFERSSNKLDLRFIPDSMEFKHAPRDVAKEAPANYESIDFQTRALQQSKIHLTWDEDEPQRSKTLKRKFNDDQLAELELKEFLASDESESDEDENDNATEDRSGKRRKKKEMYRALIQSGDGSDGDEDEEDGQDMEVTFNTALEDISKKILEKRDKKSETVWEAYQRKKNEKKKARKNRSKGSSDDDSDTDREPTEGPDDFFLEEEPAIKEKKKVGGKSGKKGNKAAETAEEEARSRAELELLLAEDDGENAGVKGYNLKRKKGKGKKGKDVLDEEKIPTVDYDDDRFSSLFTSHLFALDPTDPQFKRSAAHARQIAQKKRMEESSKRKGQARVPNEMEPDNDEPVQAGALSSKKEKYEISSLVKSLKMKSQKFPAPSNDKKSGKQGK